LPEVVAEVTEAFNRYEQALVSNDVAVLDKLFRNDRRTVRYGTSEILYGYDDIAAFRAARSPAGLARTLSRTVITAYGRDMAVASTLFQRATAPGKVGRQSQTWVRFPEGWRIVAAHVSVIDEKDVWQRGPDPKGQARRAMPPPSAATAPRPPPHCDISRTRHRGPDFLVMLVQEGRISCKCLRSQGPPCGSCLSRCCGTRGLVNWPGLAAPPSSPLSSSRDFSGT
jgi:hypothetical protein